jgi:hypothetical protein
VKRRRRRVGLSFSQKSEEVYDDESGLYQKDYAAPRTGPGFEVFFL